MNKARYQARLISCASNLRQFGMALNMYAGQSNGYVPLTYWWGRQDLNGCYNSGQVMTLPNNPILLTPLGDALFTSGIVRTPQAFYCPAANNPQQMFNTLGSNPWPMQQWVYESVGYPVRPMARADPIGGATPPQGTIIPGPPSPGRLHRQRLPNSILTPPWRRTPFPCIRRRTITRHPLPLGTSSTESMSTTSMVRSVGFLIPRSPKAILTMV